MKVKEFRLKKGYTQSDMANFLGLDQSEYSRKENGKRGFSVKELFMLEEVLEASINDLFKDIEVEAKNSIKK